MRRSASLLLLGLFLGASPGAAVETNKVMGHFQVGPGQGGFPVVPNREFLGAAVEVLGDFDGNGAVDIVFGATGADDGGTDRGAIWLIFLDAAGAIVSQQKISDTVGGFGPALADFAGFGESLAYLGDYDADGNRELAVGAWNDAGTGAVWILDLDAAGLVLSSVKIGSASGGFTGTLDAGDAFGRSAASLGDLDGDGAPELAVGANGDDDGDANAGAVWVLFLEPDGSGVKSETKLSATSGGLTGAAVPPAGAGFGWAVESPGDLDADGTPDLAVGAPTFAGGRGAVYLLTLASDGTTTGLRSQITWWSGVFDLQPLETDDKLGSSLAWLGSPFSGRFVLAAGAPAPFDGTFKDKPGTVWLIELDASHTPVGSERIGSGLNWSIPLSLSGEFGYGLASLGDFDGDGETDLLVGHPRADQLQVDSGDVHGLYVAACPTEDSNPALYSSPDDDGENRCEPFAVDGPAPKTVHLWLDAGPDTTANPADVCEDGLGEGDELCGFSIVLRAENGLVIDSFAPDAALVAALRTTDASLPGTELRIAWLDPSAPLPAGPLRLGDLVVSSGGPAAALRVTAESAAVGAALELQPIGDQLIALPEPGVASGLAAGLGLLAALARRRRRRSGAAALVALLAVMAGVAVPEPSRAATSIKGQQTLGRDGLGGLDLPGNLSFLGRALHAVGDLNGDGVPDLIAGSVPDPGHPFATHLLFLRPDGTVLGTEQYIEGAISFYSGGADDYASLGDRDGDGGIELLHVGPVNSFHGAIEILSLHPDATLKSRAQYSLSCCGFLPLPATPLSQTTNPVYSIDVLGDLDGDGTLEVAAGLENSQGTTRGSLWILSLGSDGTWVGDIHEFVPGLGDLAAVPTGSTSFGSAVAALGDLDGNGVADLAVGARQYPDSATLPEGAVFILFLQVDGPGQFSVAGHQELSSSAGNLPFSLSSTQRFGTTLDWMGPSPAGGGVLLVGSAASSAESLDNRAFLLRIGPDGVARAGYAIGEGAGVGESFGAWSGGFGTGVAFVGDVDGDEVPDLAIGQATNDPTFPDRMQVFFMQDSDHDGLDDNLDNCPFVHNPVQGDVDDDGVGDLCDNCPEDANPTQDDLDGDGEGDVCEALELTLTTTGTPASPSWALSLECGGYDVTQVNAAIVLPAGSTDPKTLTLSTPSQTITGPGLSPPQRGDAIYFTAGDTPLCNALDPPVAFGTLTTGPIGGTQLAAAALTLEGISGNAAEDAMGAIPLSDVRLVNGLPLPILDLELGPAVQTASGTRWEVRVARSNDEFHRIAFGLIAPVGTSTSDLRWLGCDTTPNGSGERLCCLSPPCGDFDGIGVGTNANPNRSWTVGPQSTPAGTQLPDTLYVVLEGTALSNGLLDTLNPASEGQFHVLGEVELSGVAAGLEPALTVDGANDIADLFSMSTVVPLEDVSAVSRDLAEVKLIGAFNPSADVDGDGIQDLGDNCPFEANPSQSNRGSFLDATDDSNPQGDACECAEATSDGAVLDTGLPTDFDLLFDFLLGEVTNPAQAEAIEARCSIAGTTECNIRDLVFLKRAIDAMDPEVDLRCDAALSPPNAP